MTSFPVNSGQSLIAHGKGKMAYQYGYQMNANNEKKSSEYLHQSKTTFCATRKWLPGKNSS